MLTTAESPRGIQPTSGSSGSNAALSQEHRRKLAGDVTEIVAGRLDAWPVGSVGQRVERVDHGNVERCEVPYVPGENRKVVDTGRRCDGKVGKARRLTRGARSVHQQPGEARRGNVERHHPVAVEMKNDIEPVVETVGADEAAGPPQLGDALADLGHGDGRQEEVVGTRVQPTGQSGGTFVVAGSPHREDVRIHQVQGGT